MLGAFYAVKAELTEDEEQAAKDALYGNGKFQGDIQLTSSQRAGMKNRVAIDNLAQRWANGIIPYTVDNSLANIKPMIQQAAAHIKQQTNGCIQFVERTNQAKYVRMYFGSGCWSYMGTVGAGAQDLSLGQGCAYFGTVVHEMLHAVGFDHEQNRPDRDQYLVVNVTNVAQDQRHNFNPNTRGKVYTSFDYQSVMIYGEKSFSNNGQRTMYARNGTPLTDPYNKKGMTPSDAYQVKAHYTGIGTCRN